MNKLRHNVIIIIMKSLTISFLFTFLCLNIEAQVVVNPCTQLTDIHTLKFKTLEYSIFPNPSRSTIELKTSSNQPLKALFIHGRWNLNSTT